MRKLIILLSLVAINAHAALSDNPADYKFSTIEQIPYSFKGDGGKVTGRNVVLVNEILKKAGFNKKVDRLFPYARAVSNLKNGKESRGYFSIERHAENKKSFKWVGPLMRPANKKVLIARKSVEIDDSNVLSNKDIKIGAIRGDGAIEFLKKFGVGEKQFIMASKSDQLFKLLTNNRCDLLLTSMDSFLWQAKQQEYTDYRVLSTYIPGSGRRHYIAFPKNTPDNVIKTFSEALTKVKKDTEFQEKLEAQYGF